jgi:MFS family permease
MTQNRYGGVPRGLALYLGVVQFLLAVSWTVYVIFLPRLLEATGLPRSLVPWLLLADQLMFMVCDVAAGLAADRMSRIAGRLGPVLVAATLVSCLAFLALPHMPGLGPQAQVLLIGATGLWVITSSALRAPLWMMLGKHAAAPALPIANAIALSGIAFAGAAAPYLGTLMREMDPRLPFAVTSAVLAATAIGLVQAERGAQRAAAGISGVRRSPGMVEPRFGIFLAGVFVLAQGFQIHAAFNTVPQYLRFVPKDSLDYLLPVFWIGFNIAMFPAAAVARRFGSVNVIVTAALLGAAGLALSARAGSLELLVAAQVIAGGAWGVVMMAGFTAATEFGRTGKEGLALGCILAAMAGAAAVRLGLVVTGFTPQPGLAHLFSWLPVATWCAGGLAIAVVAWGARYNRRVF